MDISILFGTYNRFELLQKAVASLRRNVGALAYELVVVDGGSTDGTLAWLQDQSDVVLIEQGQLLGCSAAFNEGFQHCRGASVCIFNDDAEIVNADDAPDYCALEVAQKLLFSEPGIGAVAMRHSHRVKKGQRIGVQQVFGKVGLNLGLIRTEVAGKVETVCGGIFYPGYRIAATDNEISCWVWKLGYSIVALPGLESYVLHHVPADELRKLSSAYYEADAALFFQRWSPSMLEDGGPLPNVDAETLARLAAVSRV